MKMRKSLLTQILTQNGSSNETRTHITRINLLRRLLIVVWTIS